MQTHAVDSERPHLVLVDGMNIARRVYDAIPGPDPVKRLEKFNNSIWNTFFRAVKDHSPTHLLIVFDGPGKNFRHELHPGYKAGRKPAPAELLAALDLVKERMNIAGLRNITTTGFEAEDAINTVALKAIARGYKVTALSNDKDVATMVAHGVNVFDHFDPKQQRDAAWIEQKWGVTPELLADWLALVGDQVDGVDGVDLVGDKTAAQLLRTYGGLDAVLQTAAETDEIKGKVGRNLKDQSDRARLAKRLIQLRDDVEIGVKPSEMRLQPVAAIRAVLAQWVVPVATEAAAPRL